MRDVGPLRSTRTYQEQRDDVSSRTDHKIDEVHRVIRDQLAPRIQKHSRNAVLSDRRPFYYYPKKQSGRRCSCFSIQTSPESACPICLGQGLVGGFEKWGTKTEILDFTQPDLIMVNVSPNLEEDTRPVYLKLNDNAETGYVEGTFELRANVGLMDAYLLSQPIFNRGVKIVAFDPSGNSSYINVLADFEPFLRFSTVRVRLEFTKMDERPLVSHLMLRYKLQEKLLIFGDIDRAGENLQSSQFGQMDLYEEIPIFFDGVHVSKFNNEDILIRLSDMRRFKIVYVKENIVANTITSRDIRARYVIPDLEYGALVLTL